MASWQAGLTSFLLRHLFKPQLARARTAADVRKVMNGPGPKPPLSGTSAVAATVGGVAGEWVTADAASSVGTLLYLHVRVNGKRCAMFTGDLFGRAAEYYVGAGDKRAPLASPVYADLRGLPPLLVHVGADETLLDDSRRLVENAERAGVAAELKIWPAVPHVWQLFHRWIPEGRQSLREAAAFCERRLAPAAR